MNISVIIPTYNEQNYITRCLNSLLNQTLQPLEIIVVDDGSTDGTKVIVKRYKQVTLISQLHSGPAKARNLGASIAKGDIFVFVDADMEFDHKYLQKLTQPLKKSQVQATFTKQEYVANADNIWAVCWNINCGFIDNLHIDPSINDKASTFRAIKSNIFSKTKGYLDIGYGEDVTVLSQLKDVNAIPAKGAICYHYNPTSLIEVFISARWIAQGFSLKDYRAVLSCLFPNSLRRGISLAINHHRPNFLLFKVVYDLGIIIGFIQRIFTNKHAK